MSQSNTPPKNPSGQLPLPFGPEHSPLEIGEHPQLVGFLMEVDNLYRTYWAKGVNPGMFEIPKLWARLMTLWGQARRQVKYTPAP